MEKKSQETKNYDEASNILMEVLHIMEIIREEQAAKREMSENFKKTSKKIEEDVANLRKKNKTDPKMEEKQKKLATLMGEGIIQDENIDRAIEIQVAYLDTSISKAKEKGALAEDSAKWLKDMIANQKIIPAKELKTELFEDFKSSTVGNEVDKKQVESSLTSAESRANLIPSGTSLQIINSFRAVSKEITETLGKIRVLLEELRASIDKAFKEIDKIMEQRKETVSESTPAVDPNAPAIDINASAVDMTAPLVDEKAPAIAMDIGAPMVDPKEGEAVLAIDMDQEENAVPVSPEVEVSTNTEIKPSEETSSKESEPKEEKSSTSAYEERMRQTEDKKAPKKKEERKTPLIPVPKLMGDEEFEEEDTLMTQRLQ